MPKGHGRTIALLTTLAALLLAPAAGASEVSVSGDPSNAIEFTSTADGVANNLTVAPVAATTDFRVEDTGEDITPGPNCELAPGETRVAICHQVAGQEAIRQMVVHLGPGADVFTNDTPALWCLCYGEEDADTLNGSDGTAALDQLRGGEGVDTLNGRGGDDALDGEGGTGDVLNGGTGRDSLAGGSADKLDGGPDEDTADYHFAAGPVLVNLPEPGETATGQGVAGAGDTLTNVESVEGSSENDTIDGNSQTNLLRGNAGADTLSGFSGNDVLSGDDDSDTLNGGPDNDTLRGGDGTDDLVGEGGDDRLQGDEDFDEPGVGGGLDERSADTMNGGPGTVVVDYLFRQNRVVVTLGAGGAVTADNGDTDEKDSIQLVEDIESGAGGDALSGNDLPNDINGGNGVDNLIGGAGNDTLQGAGAGDVLNGGPDPDHLMGDFGFSGVSGDDTLNGDAGNDVLEGYAGIDTINGGADGDLLAGGTGADILRGDAGIDTLKGESGADDLGGGDDADTVQYSNALSGVRVTLPAGTSPSTGNGANDGAENDTVRPDVENVAGSGYGDTLTGNGGVNKLQGLGGADTLNTADAVADTADCGDGNDTANADALDTQIACENGAADTEAPRPTADAPKDVTTAAAPTFTGTAGTAAGDVRTVTVRVFKGGTSDGDPAFAPQTAGVGDDGRWSVKAPAALAAGTYTITVEQRDAAENVGHSDPVTFTVAAAAGTGTGKGTGTGTATETGTTKTTPPAPLAAAPVKKALSLPPRPVVDPKIEGAARIGATLHANIGGWVNGVYEFRVLWRSCAADGRSDCRPTRRSDAFDYEVRRADVGRVFILTVTAVNPAGSTVRNTPATKAVAPPPKLPDLRPSGSSFRSIASARRRLTEAGFCLEAAVAECGDRVPVDLRLKGRRRSDVPRAYQRQIEANEIFEQSPDPGTEVEQGDKVRLTFYDPAEDEPSRCRFANMSERQVRREFAGMRFSRARDELKGGDCRHGWGVVGQRTGLTESVVDDAKVDFDTRGDRFIQLALVDPQPVAYREVPRVDTDGDGLWDEWETKGVDADRNGTIDLDLPAMGADPRHKDLFVEIDYMDSHKIDQAAVDMITASFAKGTIHNPDGVDGITAHIDNGPDSTMNPKTGAKWGSTRSGANSVPHEEKLGTVDAQDFYDWSAFQAVKTSNFAPARATTFRYVVSAHNIRNDGTTGVARSLPGVNALISRDLEGPSDVLVGAKSPCAAPAHCQLTTTQQAVNLMHEIGHLLGLGHGGREDLDGPPDVLNLKPNYMSIMNYFWSMTGPKVAGGFTLDFSSFPDRDTALELRLTDRPGNVYALNENALNENANLRAAQAANQYAYTYACPPGPDGKSKPRTVDTGNQRIDWNCNGTFDTGLQKVDLNADKSFTVLRSRDDWANLVFSGGAVGDFNMVLPTEEKTPVDEPSYEEKHQVEQTVRGDAVAPLAKVTGARTVRRGRRARLRIAATDDKALSRVTVQVDDRDPKVFPATTPAFSRPITLPRGSHVVVVETLDAAGNAAKRVVVRVKERKAKKRKGKKRQAKKRRR